MTHRPLDPRICNVSIDANALDRDGASRDALVDRLLALYESGTINLILPKGVRLEISNPNTPPDVQEAAPRIFSIGGSTPTSNAASGSSRPNYKATPSPASMPPMPTTCSRLPNTPATSSHMMSEFSSDPAG